MKTLIIGSDGMVGQALARLLPWATKTTHETLDITDYNAVFQLFSNERPQIVYLAAAITNVDFCEDLKTNRVNVGGTVAVSRLCDSFGATLIWFSSGYVFNGKKKMPYSEQDERDPIQNYGIQKEAVERDLLHAGVQALIIRTIGVFGDERRNKNFVKSVAASVSSNRPVFAPIDQYMNPINVSDLAQITVDLAQHHYGIYHVAGDEVMSKYDFALQVADYFGKKKLVKGVTSEEMKQRAQRPRMGALDCSETEDAGYPAPSFEKGLSRFLQAEYES